MKGEKMKNKTKTTKRKVNLNKSNLHPETVTHYARTVSGITLIALIVTIIVLLILAGVSLNLISGSNGILGKAENAREKTAIASKREEVELALAEVLLDNDGDYSQITISAVVTVIRGKYAGQTEKEAITGEATGETEDKFPGRIIYENPASGIADTIVITIGEDFRISTGTEEPAIVIAPSDYKQAGSIYYNTPDLSGFNPKCTYYVTYDTNGEPVNAGRLDQVEPPANWYDYENSLWANLVTINGGNTTYWVWIPRFKYTVDSTNQVTDVKFVSRNDICYLDDNGTKTTVDVSSYNESDAFEFENQHLAGYWMSKYRVDQGVELADTSSTSKIEVDLSGFNPDCTYYVEYDENGNELNANDITQKTKIQLNNSKKATNQPNNWYNYADKKWANIVTTNNGNTTYWTYIPRYKYKIGTGWQYLDADQGNHTNIEFISSTETTASDGYKIPDSFSFGGQNLKGYWASKYRVQQGTTTDGGVDTSASNIQIDLSGFEETKTKYVLYDSEGNASLGDNIQLNESGVATNMPENWYDYKTKKWANVVTINNSLITYWTYIPRYEYHTWTYTHFTDINFIPVGTTTASSGYKIPDAFKFANKNLKGYWVSKYRIQE